MSVVGIPAPVSPKFFAGLKFCNANPSSAVAHLLSAPSPSEALTRSGLLFKQLSKTELVMAKGLPVASLIIQF